MGILFVDSLGANLWPGDSVTTANGTGTVVGLLENSVGAQLVVVDISGVQQTFVATAVTVASRTAEFAGFADQSQAGEVD